MTRKEMIERLVEDELNSVEEMVIHGDTLNLAAWIGPMLTREYDGKSDDEIAETLRVQGLHPDDDGSLEFVE